MEIIKESPEAVRMAAEFIEEGGLVIYPTDTAYGIAADASNPLALEKLMEFKERPETKPVSVVIRPDEMEDYAEVSDTGMKLMEFLPGPITIVSKSKGKLKHPIESGQGRIGMRYPARLFAQKLYDRLGRPFTSTSANLSGRPSLYSVADIIKQIPERKLDDVMIVDGGQLPGGLSNVIDDRGFFIREGPMVVREKFVKQTRSPEESGRFVHDLIQATGAEIIFLQGDLGSGKTAIAKEIGKAMGIGDISSPTFTIINDHGKMAHADFYRIAPEELELTGFYDYVGKSLVVVEWPERCSMQMRELNLKFRTIWVKISGMGKRKIEVFTKYI